jgi:hypothetical protein
MDDGVPPVTDARVYDFRLRPGEVAKEGVPRSRAEIEAEQRYVDAKKQARKAAKAAKAAEAAASAVATKPTASGLGALGRVAANRVAARRKRNVRKTKDAAAEASARFAALLDLSSDEDEAPAPGEDGEGGAEGKDADAGTGGGGAGAGGGGGAGGAGGGAGGAGGGAGSGAGGGGGRGAGADGGVKTTLQTLPQDKVAALAGKEGVTVYQYTHDKPDVVMDGETQTHCIRLICEAFDAACRANRTASNEAMREAVMATNPLLRVYQQQHARSFAAMTVRVKTGSPVHATLEKVRKMAMLGAVERWKGEGTDEEKAARFMNVAARVSLRPTRPEDLEGGLSTRLDDVPELQGAPRLEPLGIHTFGGDVIHQE